MVIPLMVMVDTPNKAPDFEIKNQTLHTVKEAVELAQTNYVSVKSTIDPKTAGSNYDNKGAQGAGSIALGESTGTNAAAVDSVAIGHNTKVNGKNYRCNWCKYYRCDKWFSDLG